MKTETVIFTKEVKLVDADGVPIREGSVLQEITDGDRGVVVRIVRKGDRGTWLDSIGDINISTGPGTTRVTNRYDQWRHIPHNNQTYEERLASWLKQPFYFDPEYSQVSEDEAKAVSGIMAMLPDDIINDDFDSPPTRLEDALYILARHLSGKKK